MPDFLVRLLLIIGGDTLVAIVLTLIVQSAGIHRATKHLWLQIVIALGASYLISIGLLLLVHADTVFAIMVGTLVSFAILSNVLDVGEAKENVASEVKAD